MAKTSSKKTAKKTAAKPAAKTSASATLPQSADIPTGFKQLGGGYAPTWKPEEIGESITGVISSTVREVEFKQGRKVVQRRVMELTDTEGNRHAVWESAALGSLFDQISEMEEPEGVGVWLRFDGLGKKKAGQNAPKLFTIAVEE